MTNNYDKNKLSIYLWNYKNMDRVRELDKLKKRRQYNWRKIQKEFFNILL